MSIGILGPLEIDGASVSLGRRDRVVLVVLALHTGAIVTADQLASVLWPDELPPSWNKVIQGCIVRLRKRLGRDIVETTSVGYRLTIRRDDVDLHRFERLVARARDLDVDREADRVEHVLSEAIALWRGLTIAELDDAMGLAGERERLHDLRLLVEEDRVEARLRLGRHGDLVTEARALVATAPLRERRWSLLALAQYQAARQTDALRTLQSARQLLADELGLDPGPELVDLEQKILKHDPTLGRPVETVVGDNDAGPDVCPYRGLLPYEIDDDEFFFGRDAAVRASLDRLADAGVLVVVGPSGSGKSSLVRAGIGAALRRDGHDVRITTPGSTAIDSFRRACEPAGKGIVVVVDQLEEIFTQGDPTEIPLFVEQLQAWTEKAQLILALRSDYLAHIGAHRALAEITERGLVLLGPLAAEDLRTAIEEPARACGLRVEPGLVELLLLDADREPGALPLLSHAMRTTWHHREGQTLTIAAYQQAGGLRDAIGQSAERVYLDLPDERQRQLMRLLLLRLFVPNTSGEPVRTPLAKSVLGDNVDRIHLVDRLIKARLLVADQQAVSVAHESLALAWPRLRGWLDDDVDNERRLHHLATAAASWNDMGRPESELYRGPRLDAVAAWRSERAAELTGDECSFLDASIAMEVSQRDAVAHQLAIRTKANRRLRRAVVAVGCLLVISLMVGAAFVVQTGRARSDRQRARQAAVEAQRGQLIANAEATTAAARDVAALMSVEANRIAPGPSSRSALFGQFTSDPGFAGYIRLSHLSHGSAGAVALDKDRILVADDVGTVRVVNVAGGFEEGEQFPPAPSAGAGKLALSGSGTILAQLSRDGSDDKSRLMLYDVPSRRLLNSIVVEGDPTDLAVSPDGQYVAVAGGDAGGVEVLQVANASMIGRVDSPDRQSVARSITTAAITFDASGQLYISTLDGSVRVVDVPSLEEIARLPPPVGVPAATRSLTIADNGRVLVGSGYLDNTAAHSAGIAVWSLADRHVRWAQQTIRECLSLTVAAASSAVYCSDFFGGIEAFDLATGRQLDDHIDFQQGAVSELLTTIDGATLVAIGATSGALGTWRVDGSGPITSPIAPFTTTGQYNSTGTALLLFRLDAPDDSPFGTPALFDPMTGALLDSLNDLRGVAWIGDHLFATFFTDGTNGTYDTATGQKTVWPPLAFTSTPMRATLDPAGSRLLIWLTDGTADLLDTSSAQLLALPLPQAVANGSGFTSDGRRVAVATDAGTSTYDTTTWARIAGPTTDLINLAVSPTDIVAASTATGEIRFLDAVTLMPRFAPIKGGGGAIQHLEFSADGRILMARGGDAVRLFDVETGTQIGGKIDVIRPDPDSGAALRPDGLQVAIATKDGVTLWDLDVSHWETAACRLAGRNLTRTEWTRYVGELKPYQATCPQFPLDD